MTLLSIEGLKCHYSTDTGVTKAVDGISFGMEKGEILGIVGESGSGKTTIALAIMGLLPGNATSSGTIRYGDTELSSLPEHKKDTFRWKDIALVFQNSLEVLNPVMTVGMQVCEPMVAHRGMSVREAEERCVALFRRVGLDPVWMDAYPHQLSGGMRQRVMIARAIAQNTEIILLDEPTSSLDLHHQMGVLEVLASVAKEKNISILMAIHDLNLAARYCDEIIVLQGGKVFGTGSPAALFTPDMVRDTYGIHAVVKHDLGAPYVVPLSVAGPDDGDGKSTAPHGGKPPPAGERTATG